VTTAVTCGLMLFAGALTMLLGPKYATLQLPVILMVLLVGLSAPGNAGGLLLSAVGKQQSAVWVTLGQVTVYVGAFFILWPKLHLLGAILSFGLTQLIFYCLLLVVAKRIVHIKFSFGREYAAFALVALLSATLAAGANLGLITASLGWVAAIGSFLLLSGYTVQECNALTRCFIPNSALEAWTECKRQYASR
jgi:O-antigen/teichoic acid export membrane protein